MVTTQDRHKITGLLMLLLLLMAGVQRAWAEKYTAAPSTGSVTKNGTQEQATEHVKITYGGGTWQRYGYGYSEYSYDNAIQKDGSSSGVSFDSGTTVGTLSGLPTGNTPYIVLEPDVDGTIYLHYRNNNGVTNYCWVQVANDGTTKEAFTYIPHGGADVNQTNQYTVTAGKKYYFFASNSTIKFYGFTFEYDKTWDFTNGGTLTYAENQVVYNKFICKYLNGDYEGLALQQNDTWSVSASGLANSGSGSRGIVVQNLDEGDHVKVEYTLDSYSGFATHDGRSELEKDETVEDSHKYRVYRMTSNGDLALWIPRGSHILKITIVKFHFYESVKDMVKNATFTPTLIKPMSRSVSSYESSNTDVATVSNEGLITAKAGGTTVITATSSDGYTAKITVNVPIEFGWSSTDKVTVSLLDADNNNHVDAYLPTLINKNSSAVTYTPTSANTNVAWFASKSWEDPWGATLYGKPRIRSYGGTVKLTATSDGDGELPTSFDLEVTDPGETSGTYQSAYQTYEFNTTGRLEPGATINYVAYITMQYGVSADLPVVVNSGGLTVIKMIDGNGFSHPNLTNGDASHDNKIPIGGTFYKFTTTAAGKLIVVGVFDNPKMYDSDRNEITLSGAGNTRTATLESSKTYYLYNAGSNQPMLHSYRFVPIAKSLTFRNPEPIITVDVNDGTYTNPAVSAVGGPITYSVTGSATVDNSGTVTFTGNIYEPATVLVQATDGSETISYILNFAKRTWVFNENSKWTTKSTDLTGENWVTDRASTSYGPKGVTACSENQSIDYAQLTTDGSAVMPETAGLLFNKTANNERLYIGPKDYSTNFLAMRACNFAIDNVQAGQVVTINWKGANSGAVLDIQDDAGANVTGNAGGTLQLPVTQTGRVLVYANATAANINSISISTPTRAIGTLTYAKTVLVAGNNENCTGYTLTDETGVTNLKAYYSAPSNYQSSNTGVVTVNATTGELTAVATGTAIITATAAAIDPMSYQANVTLTVAVEVLSDGDLRIRTIDVSDLLYDYGDYGVNANNGLNRRIPGFDLTFEGGDGAKVNSPGTQLILRYETGQLTITPRALDGKTVYIKQAVLTVKAKQDGATFTVNGNAKTAAVEGMSLSTVEIGENQTSLVIKSTSSASFEISHIKLYYTCATPAEVDNCLDETKVAPAFSFSRTHITRIPNDGFAFSQKPTQVMTDWFKSFKLSYAYASSNTTAATINTNGSNGQLIAKGASTITATFNETDYFASSSTNYTVNNILLPGETYLSDTGEDVTMTGGQLVHISAAGTTDDTPLTIGGTSNPTSTSLLFEKSSVRRNTQAGNDGTLTLTNNNTSNTITFDWLRVISSNPQAWLYYAGQEENFKEQVHFKGFSIDKVAGFRVVDIGDPDFLIDVTDVYELGGGSYSITDGSNILTGESTTDGSATSADAAGIASISHALSKTAQGDGYTDLTASNTIRVLDFAAGTPVEWDFVNTITYTPNLLGEGWDFDDRGFHYGYFTDFMPILNYAATIEAQAVRDGMQGMLLKDEYRWYPDRGLRANLSQARAKFKFPVKKGMEIVIVAANSSANVEHTITNVTDIAGNATSGLYIEQDGYNNPETHYFIAAEDGAVQIDVTDKVGLYIKSITLRVPEIHFVDDIVTQLPTGDDGARHITNATTNIPEESLDKLTYEVTSANDFTDGIETNKLVSSISDGVITLADNTADGWKEGWFEVTVTNTNESPAALEPRSGSYRVYIVDFKYDTDPVTDGNQATATLNLNNHNGEDYFAGEDASGKPSPIEEYPVGKDKVVTPINYSYEIPEGETTRAMLRQNTSDNPNNTTYQLTAYSTGKVNVIATTGRIKATCALTVEGDVFNNVAPVLSDKEITAAGGIFSNALPGSFSTGTNTLVISVSGDITSFPASEIEGGAVKLTGLSGIGHGAIRCVVTNTKEDADDNGTPDDSSDDKDIVTSVQFVLTIAYPASSEKKWDFYRMRHGNGTTDGLYAMSNHDNIIDTYGGLNDEKTVADYVITRHGSNPTWTTTTSWEKVWKKGKENPRWAYSRSMRRDNAFVIEETAGLQIETPPVSFYVDNNDAYSDAGYTHIGVHSRSTITIPKLKNGDFVSLNLSRVIPNNGAIIEAQNVTDLAGKVVNTAFTITRSQTDYHENGELARDGDGTRIIPGYYTFIAHKEGADENDEFDVSFTLADEGYLDVLAIEIYSPKSRGGSYDPENGYDYTMRNVRLDAAGYPDAPITLLKEEGQQRVYDLTYCHPLWSTSVGPAEYVLRDKTDNLHADFENVGWYSAGGALYNNGRITVNDGYGRITVRMENYTADSKYLIGYTPDYSLTVGHPPHQDYPFTWNFENISGGAVKGRGNNAYNSISTDYYTWQNLGYEAYQLDTRTSSGSLYVPGATLVTASRDLGAKGEISYLNSHNLGCDEFNGLGFNGQIAFRTALQASEEPAAPENLHADNSLLEYKMIVNEAYTVERNKANTADSLIFAAADRPADAETKTYWKAGDGLIMFGSAGKRQASTLYPSYEKTVYLMDGGNTKYLLIKPERRLKEGDVITLKGYTPNNVVVLRSGFSFYAAQYDNSYDDLLTLNWETSDNTQEHTITHTVQQGDGLAGRDSVYIFRAGKQYSVYLTEISITTTDESTLVIPDRALTCNGAVTVTIPDLEVDHYVYIKSSAAPTAVPSILTPAIAADGLDAIEGEVYKYKVVSSGNADVTFADGTKIYRIGVTNIMKPLKRVGTGDAWATESRNHAIDYTQTGAFTVNDIKANTVTASSYANNKVTVRLNEKTDAMPAESGMVLKLKMKYAEGDDNGSGGTMTSEEATTATTAAETAFGKTKSYKSTDKTGEVPLFYPPHSAMILNSNAVAFGGTEGNLMIANLYKRELTHERESGVIDKDGDNMDDSGNDEGIYTRFIFADRYMKWTKIDNDVTHTADFTESGEKPVFYRLHVYEIGDTVNSSTLDAAGATALNTLGANKSYMLIRSGNVPDAIWKSSPPSPAKRYIGIEGISDIYEFTDDSEISEHSKLSGTYNMQGQKMDDNAPLPAGIYVIDGRKVVVK